MKKSILLAALAVFSLTACDGDNIPEAQGMTDLKAAQLVESNKGVVGFDVNGTFKTSVYVGNTQIEKVNISGIAGTGVFEMLPASIADLSFNLLQRLNARFDIRCTTLEAKYNEGDSGNKTVVEMLNPSLTIGLNNNVAAFGVTQGTLENIYIGGQPIEAIEDCVWRVTPWCFASDFDLPYYDPVAFSTYAGVFFNFKKAGGYTRATLSLDYAKASQLYVAANLALWMGANPGDLSDADYNRQVGNVREALQEDIQYLIGTDFDFNFWVEYEATRGINQFGVRLDGKICPNYLEASSLDEIISLDLGVDLTFKHLETATFTPFLGEGSRNVRPLF